jgi:hypothetical protein
MEKTLFWFFRCWGHGLRSFPMLGSLCLEILYFPGFGSAWNNLGDLLLRMPDRLNDAERAYRSAIACDPDSGAYQSDLALLLMKLPGRSKEAETAMSRALELEPDNGALWAARGVILACGVNKPEEAEAAFRKATELIPDEPKTLRNLGVLLYCQVLNEEEAVEYLRRAADLEPSDPVSAAVLGACSEPGAQRELAPVFMGASSEWDFWNELLDLIGNYPPFGKIFARICDLIENQRESKGMARLCRAVAFAQLGDFPRASVALEDALLGDPIDLLATGRKALEIFLAAAVRNNRAQECVELIDKKGWKDAWRPIYEALRAVESGSTEYFKRIAVEIRDPAMIMLRRIAPELQGLEGRPRL